MNNNKETKNIKTFGYLNVHMLKPKWKRMCPLKNVCLVQMNTNIEECEECFNY